MSSLIVLSSVLIAVRGSTNAPNVVIVGAGVGGTSCAYYLSKEVPGAKIMLLEAQADVGESRQHRHELGCGVQWRTRCDSAANT